MIVVRGIAVSIAIAFLCALCGGAAAKILLGIAPGYYPVRFPDASQNGYLADAAIGIGYLDGLGLGLPVSAAIAVGLGWFRQLHWAPCIRGLFVVFGCAVTCGVAGGLIGRAVGTLLPGYYRGVFRAGNHPDFDPVDIGTGLGTGQGLALGVVVGAVIVVALAWQRSRRGAFSSEQAGTQSNCLE